MQPVTMRWLLLSLAVLLAHLGLLQAFLVSPFGSAQPVPAPRSTHPPAPSWVIRAIAQAPDSAQPPTASTRRSPLTAPAPAARPVHAALTTPPQTASRPTRVAAPAMTTTLDALAAPDLATTEAPAAGASAPSAALPAWAPSASSALGQAVQPAEGETNHLGQQPTALSDLPGVPAQHDPAAPASADNSSLPADPKAALLPAPPLRFDSARLSPSVRLTYVLSTSKFPISLSAELLWQRQGQRYEARLSYSAFGRSRSQTSRGQITDHGLAPERFADKYRSELAAHFNYLEGKVSFSANTPDAALLSGAQDRLSVLLQLGALAASDPDHFSPGRTLTLQTVGPRSADLWLFSVIQTELLSLPGGQVHSLKLERLPREPYDQRVEVWLSPELGYLPARIRITEANGDSVDQQWSASAPAEPAR